MSELRGIVSSPQGLRLDALFTNYKLDPENFEDMFEAKKYNLVADDMALENAPVTVLFDLIIAQIESE